MTKLLLSAGLILGSLAGAGIVVHAEQVGRSDGMTIAFNAESSRSVSSLGAANSERAVTEYWAIWYKATASSPEVLYRDPSNGELVTFGDAKTAKDSALYWKEKFGWYSVNWVKYTRRGR
jgi:hypothetical protein